MKFGKKLGLPFQLALALLVLSSNCLGQNRIHFGLGFNQSYASLDSLNYILNAYNAENSWIAKPMREIHLPAGICGHLGADFNAVLVEFGYTMRMATTKAKGENIDGQPNQQTHIRYSANTVDLGLGAFFVHQSRFRLAAGASVDVGNLRISGRSGLKGQIESQVFGRYVNELNFGLSGFLHFMMAFQDGYGPGIFIRPYYQMSMRKNDYGPLNRAIRQNTGGLADPHFILGNQSNVGIKLGFFFGS